jgi:competence protein ComEC
LPFLDYMGVSRLHAIVLSHHDIDHINGVPEVVDRRRVDHVYADDTFLVRSQTSPTGALLIRHLESRGIKVERVPKMIEAGPARVTVLWPIGDPNAWQEISDNDLSLVSEIEFADRRILLCSDIEEFGQQQILRLHQAMKIDVAVAPHHGSVRTLDPGFLRQLEAATLLCSCGRTDLDQERVIERADEVHTCYTARDGAISICVDADGAVQRWMTR